MRNHLVVSACLVVTVFNAQSEQRPTLKTVISRTSPHLVKITETVVNPSAISNPEIRAQLLANRNLIMGTGFIVSAQGDIVTADHVVKGLQQFEARVRALGTEAHASVGITQPGVSINGNSIAGNTVVYPLKVVAEDVEHDLAIIRAESGDLMNPPTNMMEVDGKRIFDVRPESVKISIQHLDDGDEVFASGFPLSEDSPVTTVGSVASAWGFQVLNNAASAGLTRKSEIIDLDMRINNGNSGGPLFLYKNQSVVGVVVETRAGQTASSGAVAVAVPVKYITAFLDQNHVKWLPAPKPH